MSSILGATSSNESTTKLLEMMAFEADVELIFDQAHTGDKDISVLAHSCILRMHSGVIANALTACSNSQGQNTSSSALKRIPMPGSLKADFLVVAPFIYPTLPLPEVSWDNLQTLLVEGRKWDMAVVLAKAAAFIQTNSSMLDMTADSKMFAFRWLKLADTAALQDACQACVDMIVDSSPNLCSQERLQGLSPSTLQQLVVGLVGKTSGSNQTIGNRHCSYCGVSRNSVCQSCHRTF